jgi:non-ribosomal peptide synthetase component E (peptide arylation enzyme)
MVPQTVVDTAIRFGVRPVRVYGSSEAPYSTSTALTDRSAVDDGVALPGVEVATRDGDELVIRGPRQFHGYLDAADNADAFSDDWFRTGDQADIVNGRVRITGRLKEVVIRKGMKISLAEVDTAAAVLGECAAFGMPDEMCGERVALADRGGADITYDSVVERLSAAGLARWKLPEQIVLWDGPFRRNASGKIVRHQLADSCARYRSVCAPRLNARSSARP